jgi:hypothetical protein
LGLEFIFADPSRSSCDSGDGVYLWRRNKGAIAAVQNGNYVVSDNDVYVSRKTARIVRDLTKRLIRADSALTDDEQNAFDALIAALVNAPQESFGQDGFPPNT